MVTEDAGHRGNGSKRLYDPVKKAEEAAHEPASIPPEQL